MKKRLFLEWILLLAVGILLAFAMTSTRFTQRLDALMLDRSAALGRSAPDTDIAIVAIDDDSLSQIGAWPWSRESHAALIQALSDAGARQIYYDILFMEPTSPEADGALAEAVGNAGNVVLPMSFAPAPNRITGAVAALPLPALVEKAQAVGHVAATPDTDGVLRRFDLERSTATGETYPHFIAAGLGGQTDGDWPDAPVISAHSAGTYPTVSASAVIAGEVPRSLFEGRDVLVGATAQGMGDRYPVAAGSAVLMPGVEAQANLLDALRNGTYLREAHWAWSAALAALALILQFLVFWKLPARTALYATIAIALGSLALSALLVPLAGFWVAPATAVILVGFAYPFWSWRRLTAVSSYLEREAARLEQRADIRETGEGFDIIARQVSRVRSLVGHVNRSFAFLRSVIEAAPDAIVVFDETGKSAMANRRFLEIMPDFADNEDVPFATFLDRSGAQFDDPAGELVLADGRTFLVASRQFEMQNREGSWDIMALRDVTEAREREQEWREMLEFLSHDMRTPQVAIIGLADRVDGERKPDSIGQRIRLQAEKTLKLADDFVQLARLNEAELECEETDLAALADEACDAAYSQARRKNISVRTEYAPEEHFAVQADPSLIARLLDNLVGNAIKYSPEGSAVLVALEPSGDDAIQLSVSDSGPGLPPERMASPFDRFGSRATQGAISAGLGLSFVKRVVDRHKGTVTVGSSEEGGTRFRVILPRGSVPG